MKRLYLSDDEKKMAGVCGGIAEYLNIDPTIVRLLFIAASFTPLTPLPVLVLYIICWMIIPRTEETTEEIT